MRRYRGLTATIAIPALAITMSTGFVAPAAFAAPGDLPWMDTSLPAAERANLLIDAMSFEQKVQQISILPFDESDTLVGCEFEDTARQIKAIPELAIPTVRMTNGGTGMKGGSCQPTPVATGLPSSELGAATFDRAHNRVWGEILGEESHAWAHQVMLAPGLNLIRHPYGGRSYEYFSEDPYLSGALGVEQTLGIQSQGVQAMIKHLAGNEQEYERWTAASDIPSRAMAELYMLPFEMAVKDGNAASAMCSFPDVNETYACENDEMLIDTMRDRWGFDGWIMSDRRATHSTVDSIKARNAVELDWEAQWYTEELIQMHLDAGDITMADIDQLLFDRYLKMFEFGQFEDTFDAFLPVDLTTNGQQAREIAEDGIVLLKNENQFLPLDGDVQSVALIGAEWYAGMAKMSPRSIRANNENVNAPYTITPQQGLQNIISQLGYDTNVTYNDGNDIERAVALAARSDVVVLMAGDNPHETGDRVNLKFPVIEGTVQEELIPAVLAANPNTVLVLKSSGTMDMPWLDQVPAVVEAWYPGQDDGDVVAEVLYGLVNPSGKLPMTFGNTDREAAFSTEEQYPGVREDTGKPGGPGPFGDGSDQLQVKYTEDLAMGYRWYEQNGVEPLYPFGFGLSYTTFGYSDLAVTPTLGATGARALTVEFTITNTGTVAGAEAAQVYLTLPAAANEPAKRLVGFDKPYLEPGASARVSVMVDSAASNHPFGYFVPDPNGTWADGEWAEAAGDYIVHVGGSSAVTPLEQTVVLDFPEVVTQGDIPIGAEIPDTSTVPGALTLRINPFDGLVKLGPAQTQVDRIRFDGDLPTVTITDSRNDMQAGDGGWTVSGSASDFVAGDNEFGADHLGWIPWTTASGRPGVVAGPEVQGVMRGGPGLAVPATLVSATNEGRRGAATAGAHLLLEVPLTTPPGDYRSSVHLSLFPVD